MAEAVYKSTEEDDMSNNSPLALSEGGEEQEEMADDHHRHNGEETPQHATGDGRGAGAEATEHHVIPQRLSRAEKKFLTAKIQLKHAQQCRSEAGATLKKTLTLMSQDVRSEMIRHKLMALIVPAALSQTGRDDDDEGEKGDNEEDDDDDDGAEDVADSDVADSDADAPSAGRKRGRVRVPVEGAAKYVVLKQPRAPKPKVPCPTNVKKALHYVKPMANAFSTDEAGQFKAAFVQDFSEQLDVVLRPKITEPKVIVTDKLPADIKASDLEKAARAIAQSDALRESLKLLLGTDNNYKQVLEQYKPAVQELTSKAKELEQEVVRTIVMAETEMEIVKEVPIPAAALQQDNGTAAAAGSGADASQPPVLVELKASKKVKKVPMSKEEVMQLISELLDEYLASSTRRGVVEFDMASFIQMVDVEMKDRSVELTDDKKLTVRTLKRPAVAAAAVPGILSRSSPAPAAATAAAAAPPSSPAETAPKRPRTATEKRVHFASGNS